MSSHSLTAERRGAWSILGAGMLWGTTGVTTQFIYNVSSTNALSVAFMRLGICALILLICGLRVLGRRMWRVSGRDLLLMVFLGVMQAIFQFTYLAAIPECGITIATLIALCVAPVLVVIYSALFLRERITLKIALALICAVGGTILLSDMPTSPQHSGHMLTGVLLSLACAASYAGVIVGGRTLSQRCSPVQVNAVAFGVGALLLLACSLTTPLVFSYSPICWLLLFYLGCIPTALAYLLFQSGMRATPATLTSILTLAEPLTAAILAWIIFDERLSFLGIIGAILLLGTILLLARAPKPATT
ncbi:MAG TPA: EamA family transporter [Ktedonobacteraceae bacterium]|nr:EamA family transporter [Ktedonobacteraceae bacterium]